jgi:hypothetical protein
MKAYTFVASTLAIGLYVPAMAQQPRNDTSRFFKYTDTAVKAMTENPQDRLAQAAKLAESFGGKMESAHQVCCLAQNAHRS